MDWIAIAAPLSAILGALIGGMVTLRVNASSTQHHIAEEFAELSRAQSNKLRGLREEITLLRERIAVLEEEATGLKMRHTEACLYIRRVVGWDEAGRESDFPKPPDMLY
ncbi:MAG: hypothetical protein WAN89_02685 [Lawsonella sp.]|nr:hypothetical protein [Mycobacteriales bacterium]